MDADPSKPVHAEFVDRLMAYADTGNELTRQRVVHPAARAILRANLEGSVDNLEAHERLDADAAIDPDSRRAAKAWIKWFRSSKRALQAPP